MKLPTSGRSRREQQTPSHKKLVFHPIKSAPYAMLSFSQAVNQAQRRGEGVDTSKKCKNTTREYSSSASSPSLLSLQVQVDLYICQADVVHLFAVTAATNKQRSAAKDTAKLDRETEELHRTPSVAYAASYCHAAAIYR